LKKAAAIGTSRRARLGKDARQQASITTVAAMRSPAPPVIEGTRLKMAIQLPTSTRCTTVPKFHVVKRSDVRNVV
jgi:hypothetical protein